MFLHISSGWVKIMLHTKNQFPRLSESPLEVCGGVVWVRGQLFSSTKLLLEWIWVVTISYTDMRIVPVGSSGSILG